jgi:hypothetical protein
MPFGASGVHRVRTEAYTAQEAIDKIAKQEKYAYNLSADSGTKIVTKYSYMDDEYNEYERRERNKNKATVFTGRY